MDAAAPPTGKVTYFDTLAFGVCAGSAAAVLYTLSNVALRWAVGIDPYLVAAVKAVPTIVGLGPVIGMMIVGGRPLYRHRSTLPKFTAVALVGQFIGNVAFQIALNHVGLAASVPITLGTMVVSGALFGWWMLGELVSRRKWVAMAVLIAAVVVLSSGRGVDDSLPADRLPWWGGVCAATAGIAFGLFGTVMRGSLREGLSMWTAMFISGVVGTTGLWAFAVFRMGGEAIAAVPPEQWRVMAAAGAFNLAAFITLTASFRVLPVVAVNLINASQVALAGLAGVAFFDERVTAWLIAGVAMTFGGLLVLAGGKSNPGPTED